MKAQLKAIKLFIVIAFVYGGYYLPINQMELTNGIQTATVCVVLSVVYAVTGTILWAVWVVLKKLLK